jgi:dihydroxyacetone kinase-like protein
MQYFSNAKGAVVVQRMIATIQANKDYLGEIDGKIGDGDHGINMNKGFTVAGERIGAAHSFSEAIKILSQVLMLEIGGSMGPLYGSFFKAFFKLSKDTEKITAPLFLEMLEAATAVVKELGGANVGDKTLVDTLTPAIAAFNDALANHRSFQEALDACVKAAEAGKNSTKDMLAKIGRSARLGERSRGVLDAGAVSSFLLLDAMAKQIGEIMEAD